VIPSVKALNMSVIPSEGVRAPKNSTFRPAFPWIGERF
jgi:hypothetical protein